MEEGKQARWLVFQDTLERHGELNKQQNIIVQKRKESPPQRLKLIFEPKAQQTIQEKLADSPTGLQEATAELALENETSNNQQKVISRFDKKSNRKKGTKGKVYVVSGTST